MRCILMKELQLYTLCVYVLNTGCPSQCVFECIRLIHNIYIHIYIYIHTYKLHIYVYAKSYNAHDDLQHFTYKLFTLYIYVSYIFDAFLRVWGSGTSPIRSRPKLCTICRYRCIRSSYGDPVQANFHGGKPSPISPCASWEFPRKLALVP